MSKPKKSKPAPDPAVQLASLLADFDRLAAVPAVAEIGWFQVLKALSVLALLSGAPDLPPAAQAALETAGRVVGDYFRRGDFEAISRAVDGSKKGWALKKAELAAALLTTETGVPPSKGDLFRVIEARVPALAADLPLSRRGRGNLFTKANLKSLPQTRGNS